MIKIEAACEKIMEVITEVKESSDKSLSVEEKLSHSCECEQSGHGIARDKK